MTQPDTTQPNPFQPNPTHPGDSAGFRVLLHILFSTAVGTTILTSDVTTIASSLGIIVLALTGSFAYAAGVGKFSWTGKDLAVGAFLPTYVCTRLLSML